MHRRAFTLIEVLVVIAIVASVAAILFPVFVRARERARCTTCVSNLKQLYGAVGCYLQDWDARYPYGYDAFWITKGYSPSVTVVMNSYVSDPTVWHCPSDIGETWPRASNGFLKSTPPFFSFLATSYGYFGIDQIGAKGVLAGVPTSRVKVPTLAPLFWDGRPWHVNWERNTRNALYSMDPGNTLYCDGHVVPRAYQQLVFEDVPAAY